VEWTSGERSRPAATGTIHCIFEQSLLEELLNTLRHRNLAARLEKMRGTAEEVFAKDRRYCPPRFPPSQFRVRLNCAILRTFRLGGAVAAEAGTIVTGDRDLLTLEPTLKTV
jgi:hypothetical protein